MTSIRTRYARAGLILVAVLLVATILVGAPAKPAAAAAPDTATFIDGSYELFLGRGATGNEIAHWDSVVDRGDRSQLMDALSTSPEWAGVRVDELYRKILRRGFDASGRSYWLGRIRGGLRLEDIAAMFYGSAEYWNRSNRSAPTFVDNLYRDLLGRPSDAGGRSYWVGRLQAGWSRSNIASGFYGSIESRTDRVSALYHEVLGRGPDAGGLIYWADRLRTLGDVSLSSWLASSDEFYRRMTGRPAPAPGVIRLSGAGERTFRVDLLGPTIVRSHRPGGGHFAITMLDHAGEFDGLAANEIAPYRGEHLIEHWRDTRYVEVDADGGWTAELIPLRYARSMSLASGSGNTDQVRRVSVPNARLTRITHSGSNHFAVVARDGNGDWIDLLVNEVGPVDVTEVVPRGTVYLEISSDGPWTIR